MLSSRNKFLILSLLVISACTGDQTPPTAVAPSLLMRLDEGRGEFQRYVAIGTSISMGVVSDGVNESSQRDAWPAQLSRLANREPSLPLIQMPGCGAPLQAPLASGVRINGEGAGQPADSRVCAPNVDGVTLPTGNVAVDGARTRDALFSTTTTYGGMRGAQYGRVLPPGETQLSAALAQNPKVLSIELGGNEVLGSRSGIYLPGVTVEPTPVFKELYTSLLDQVQGAGVKHVLLFGLIDDPMEFPGFRTGQELWDARATFTPFNVAVGEDCGTINATNVLFVAVRVPDAVARGAARARAGLGPHELNCVNAPSASGIQDFVLSGAEVQLLAAQIAEMDAFIRSEAARRGYAYARLGALYSDVNVKAPFNAITMMTTSQPYGPYIGLDGIHPNAAGQTVLADAAARALNATYDLGIPQSASVVAAASVNPASLAAAPVRLAAMQGDAVDPLALAREEGWEGGAFVLNSGAGKPNGFCFYQGGAFVAQQVTVVRSPSGNWTLSCHFEGLAPIAEQETATGWLCSIIGAPMDQTHQSAWVRTPSGTARLTCQFSGKPIEDAAVRFDGVAAPAQQGAFSLPLGDIPGQQITGETAAAGLACTPIGSDLTGKIAIVERGVCAFSVKVQNAMNAGASAVIVYNSAPFGDQIIIMSGIGRIGIPAVFVGRSTGLALLAAAPSEVTITYCGRSASCRGAL
jgi:hypothetical protein